MVHGGMSSAAAVAAAAAAAAQTAAANQSNQIDENMDKSVDDSTGAVQNSTIKTFTKAQQMNVHMNTVHVMNPQGNENEEDDPSGTDKITDIAME